MQPSRGFFAFSGVQMEPVLPSYYPGVVNEDYLTSPSHALNAMPAGALAEPMVEDEDADNNLDVVGVSQENEEHPPLEEMMVGADGNDLDLESAHDTDDDSHELDVDVEVVDDEDEEDDNEDDDSDSGSDSEDDMADEDDGVNDIAVVDSDHDGIADHPLDGAGRGEGALLIDEVDMLHAHEEDEGEDDDLDDRDVLEDLADMIQEDGSDGDQPDTDLEGEDEAYEIVGPGAIPFHDDPVLAAASSDSSLSEADIDAVVPGHGSSNVYMPDIGLLAPLLGSGKSSICPFFFLVVARISDYITEFAGLDLNQQLWHQVAISN